MNRATILGPFLLALIVGCAPKTEPAAPKPPTPCATGSAVRVLVDSGHFYDVWIRDADGLRIGLAPGLKISELRWCVSRPMDARFIIDPVAGQFGAILQDAGTVVPGSVVVFTLGAELRISFVRVLAPQ